MKTAREGDGAPIGMSKAADFIIEAPAKTNLSLRVLGKRADGFHAIETRICRLSLSDTLEFRYSAAGKGATMTCDDDDLPAGEENLVLKAVRAMERYCHQSFDVAIDLRKRIPSGAGLGGGSSDAAAVLKGLNHLFDLRLSPEKLAKIAAGIGSDVAFFCYDATALCSGRGEIVEPFEFEWKLPLLVIKPHFEISASYAYQKWADSIENPGISYIPQVCPWGEMLNDLERPVYEKFIVLARLKMWLLDQGEVHAALLSGSGSCLFAILTRNDSGERLGYRLRETFGQSFQTEVCHTLP